MNFDEAAGTWDDPRRRERANVLAGAIVKSWHAAPETVLDFGCGSGLIAFQLCPYAGTVYGYDPSPEMARVFQEKLKTSREGNARLLTAAEMRDRAFDAIVSSMVFHHIPDVGAEILALKARLKPGGRFYWIDLDEEDGSFHADDPAFDGHNGFKRRDVLNILRECGFHEVSIRTVFEGAKDVGGRMAPYSLFLAIAG